MPFHDTCPTSPAAGAAGDHVFTTAPESTRTSVTVTFDGAPPEKRNENVTPPAWSRAKSDRDVAVSSRGAPASVGPGAGERCGLGFGAGGGMILIDFALDPRAVPAYATTRPLCAVKGTGTVRTRSDFPWTFTDASSRVPRAPVKTTRVTPLSREPRSLTLPPSRTRPPDMQLAAHFTLLIVGDGTYAVPPVAASADPPPAAAATANATPAMRPQCGRDCCVFGSLSSAYGVS